MDYCEYYCDDDVEVTEEFRVDQYDTVYDNNDEFFCKWIALTEREKEIVRNNPFSAYQNKRG